MLDLCHAYLQVHIDKLLWPFQTVKINRQRYCLTHLGFGFNIPPLVMWSIMNAMSAQSKTGERAFNNIFINESVCIRAHLQQFGQTNLEHLESGTCVLGLLSERSGVNYNGLVEVNSQHCLICSPVVVSFLCVGSWLDIRQYVASYMLQSIHKMVHEIYDDWLGWWGVGLTPDSNADGHCYLIGTEGSNSKWLVRW